MRQKLKLQPRYTPFRRNVAIGVACGPCPFAACHVGALQASRLRGGGGATLVASDIYPYIVNICFLGFNLSFWSILGVLGNWGRLCLFEVIFSANDSVFRAEHAPLLRTTYFLSKARYLRVRKEGSTLKLQAR